MTTSNRTINLTNVQEWIIYPKSNAITHQLLIKNNIKHMPEVCTVILNDGRKVNLVSGNIPSSKKKTNKNVLVDPVVSIDQITPFFDAMKKGSVDVILCKP